MEKSMNHMYKNMFNLARGLNSGYELLKSKYSENGDLIPPSILCSTFCVEILLKCLQIIKFNDVYTKDDLTRIGININAHKYSDIFDKIDPDIREKIIGTYNQLFNENISEFDYKNKLIKLGENNFVNWRYVFESSSSKYLDIALQDKIINSLGKTIEEILESKSSKS